MKPLNYTKGLTCRAFCKATGWPYAEWMALTVQESQNILKLYDYSHSDTTLAMDKAWTHGYETAMAEINAIVLHP